MLCHWARRFVPVKPRKTGERPEMTEKVLTGTLGINTKNIHRVLVHYIRTF